MDKNTLLSVALGFIAVVASGGAYYYFVNSTVEQAHPSGTASPAKAQPPVPRDDEMKRQTLESIGSINGLKPVPLQPAQQ